MNVSEIIDITEMLGDITKYINNNYTLMELVKAGVFNNYGVGNIFHKTYGPYRLAVGSNVKITHETDNDYGRVLQIAHIDAKNDNKRTVEPMYNYSITMTPTTTTFTKIKSSTEFDIFDTYITVLFQKNRGLLTNETGIIVFENVYIARNYETLCKIKNPAPAQKRAYCIQEHTPYQFANGTWTPINSSNITTNKTEPNYDRLNYVEMEYTELVMPGQSIIATFSPVSHADFVFPMVSQVDVVEQEHISKYNVRKELDRVVVSNLAANPCRIWVQVRLCYNSDGYTREYYSNTLKFILDNNLTQTHQETNAFILPGELGTVFDTSKLE